MSKVIRPRNAWAWLSKEKSQAIQGSGNEQFMAEINALPQVLRTLAADDVLVRGMLLMNTLPMHESAHWVRKFDKKAVEQTVPMVAGKPVLVNHTTDGMDGLPVGRFFRAESEDRGDGNTWMSALFFMLKDAQGIRLANAIDSGMIAENSPTLEFDRVYCSICEKDDLDCDHVPGKLYSGKKCFAVMSDIVDFWEGSLAWAGMQRDTGFYIAAGRDPSKVVTMDDYLTDRIAQRLKRAESPADEPQDGWGFMSGTEH